MLSRADGRSRDLDLSDKYLFEVTLVHAMEFDLVSVQEPLLQSGHSGHLATGSGALFASRNALRGTRKSLYVKTT